MVRKRSLKSLIGGIVVGASFVLGTGANVFAATLPSAPYTVQSGQTAMDVARVAGFGLGNFSLVNGLSPNAVLSPGQQVAMPFLYLVDSGDQLWYLARQYDTTIADIERLNQLHSMAVYPGETLLIARGSASVAPASGQSDSSPNASALSAPLTAPSAWSTVQPSQPSQPSWNMTATAYDNSMASNGPWGAVDYFGQPLAFGDVAVDPSVIPLGTRVFISGYSDPALPRGGFYATAVDEGAAITGNRVDLYLPSAAAANQFGMERVQVTKVG